MGKRAMRRGRAMELWRKMEKDWYGNNNLKKKKARKKDARSSLFDSAMVSCRRARACLTGRKRKGGVVVSIYQNQLMATDDGEGKGQGSNPCIVSLGLVLLLGFPPSVDPPLPKHTHTRTTRPQLPPAHLHLSTNVVRRCHDRRNISSSYLSE